MSSSYHSSYWEYTVGETSITSDAELWTDSDEEVSMQAKKCRDYFEAFSSGAILPLSSLLVLFAQQGI